jgi:phage protein D/phage baseplate assembly protein gpV
MPATTFLSQFFVKVGGNNVPQAFMDDVLEIVVDSSLYLPEMFTILVQDPTLQWVDDTGLLDLGKEVEISVQTSEQLEWGQSPQVLMKGEIVALEPTFSAQGGTTLLVRGYNKSHRLHRGKQTRTFLKKKDSDLASQIAGEVGLSAQVDTTSVTHDYIIQSNQTNMAFLQSRADRLGYKVFAADGKLCFKKGDASLGTGPELNFGEELIEFRPSMAASHQADKVVVRGWDPKQKQLIKAEASPPSSLNQGGVSKTGGAVAKSAFGGSAQAIIVDRPVSTQAEAQSLATGLANDLAGEFIEAEGVCYGHPGIKAGHTVTISRVGTRFSGKYYVTAATHTWSRDGYETLFTISGRQPNTISHLLEAENGHQAERGLIRGVVPGVVTNLNDPENLGRIKVKYDWLGDNIESDWIRVVSPMGGSGRGFFYLPEVNDEVLLAFEHGDIHHPYMIGTLWNSKDKPPSANNQVVGSGKVNQRILKSRTGHIVILDDTQGSEQIVIRDKTGKNEMVIDSAKNSMAIKVDGDFTVEAKGKITLNSTQDMTLESKKNMTLESTSNGKFKAGSGLNLETNGNGTVKGTQLTVEGSARSELKGATVSVQGTSLAEIKGMMVKIN